MVSFSWETGREKSDQNAKKRIGCCWKQLGTFLCFQPLQVKVFPLFALFQTLLLEFSQMDGSFQSTVAMENFTSHLSRPNSITYNATIAACARAAAWRQALTLLARRSAAEIFIVSYHKVISCGFLPQLSHDLEEKKQEEIVHDMA